MGSNNFENKKARTLMGLENLKGSKAEAREIRKGLNVDGVRISSKGLKVERLEKVWQG